MAPALISAETSRELLPSPTRGKGKKRRKGLAPLELALMLPVVLMVFALVVYIGFWMFNKAGLTTAARNNAFRQRYPESGGGVNSKFGEFKGNAGQISGKQLSKKLDMFPLVKDFAPVTSKSVAVGDAWDFRHSNEVVALKRGADLKGATELGMKAPGDTLANIGESATSLSQLPGTIFNNIGNLFSSGFESLITSQVESMFPGALSMLSGFTGDVNNAKQQSASKQASENKKRDDQIAADNKKIDDEIARLEGRKTTLTTEQNSIRGKLERAKDPKKEEDKLTEDQKKALEKRDGEITTELVTINQELYRQRNSKRVVNSAKQ